MKLVQDPSDSDDTMSTSVAAFVATGRAHPRFRLRYIAIVAAMCGSVLNLIALMLTLSRYGDLAIATGCAYIPLLLSMVWDIFDLTSKHFLGRELAPALLVMGDGLACTGFLVIIVLNGIFSGGVYDSGIAVLTTYNSVPWMICYCIHFIIALRAIKRACTSIRLTHRCVNCGHSKTTWGNASGKDGIAYTPLGSQDQYEDDDVEANAAAEQTEAMVQKAASPDQAY